MGRMTNCKGSTGGRHPWRAAAAFAALVALTAALSAAWADTTPITSSTMSVPVTVARAGGATVKGTITECTPELLKVQPAPKPRPVNAKPGTPDPPTPDPVEVPWKDVRHVSNGLTARLALEIWKAQHANQLCPTCRGERTVMCPVCKGTNHDPAAAADCKTCHGELLVDCKSKGEVGGKVGCPNGCLRLSVGNWKKQPDGSMRRTWVWAGGSAWVSDHHLGDVVILDQKAGNISDLGKCMICGGTSLVDDPLCHGTGKIPCPECVARKAAGPCPNHCDAGRVVCPTCNGTGLAKG
jgi:hypothetical protein